MTCAFCGYREGHLVSCLGGFVKEAAEARTFDGETFSMPEDGARLGAQLTAVRVAMSSGAWFTLAELARMAGASEASVSARIRDLRKPRFGSWTVERRRVEGGLHEYRAVRNGPEHVSAPVERVMADLAAKVEG